MPRHKITPGQLAPKNSTRSRIFSIVIHDVKPNSKETLEKEINDLSPDWSLIAEENYNHQDGSHIHLFLRYAQVKAKSAVLRFIQKLELGGRVQVDIGRGQFSECEKYLKNPDKNKFVDPNVSRNVKRLTLVEKYPDKTYKCPKCDRRHFVPWLPGHDQALCPRAQDGLTLCQDCWSSEINKKALQTLREKFSQDA